MATYSLRPLTAAQIRTRKRAWLLVLAVSLAVLIATVAIWMNLPGGSEIRNALFPISLAAVVVAIFAGFGFGNFEAYVRGRERHAYEVSPQGVRFYTGLTGNEAGEAATGPSRPARPGDTRFLPLAAIRRFESSPAGGGIVRGRFGYGGIYLPGTLDGLEHIRQELLALGVAETPYGPTAWRLRRAAVWGWIVVLAVVPSLLLFASDHLWEIATGALIYLALIGWAFLVSRRLYDGGQRRTYRLNYTLLAILLFLAGQQVWRLDHPRTAHPVRTTVPSSLR